MCHVHALYITKELVESDSPANAAKAVDSNVDGRHDTPQQSMVCFERNYLSFLRCERGDV
jgi:hypothetical protein